MATRRSRTPGPVSGPEQCRRQPGGGRGTDDDLPGGRGAFHLDDLAHGLAAQDELAVAVAREEAVHAAGVDAGRHPQHDAPRGGVEPADLGQPALHADRAQRRAFLVRVVGEEEEQRIATELEEAAARGVRDGEERFEALADPAGDLFGAHLAVPGETLGHLGEARDVDERERGVDGHPALVRVLPGPVDGQAGEIRTDRLGRHRQGSCSVGTWK